ncbi:MAG: methyltransferase domain-containing protein [Desulfuromonadales bacterium]|nr:methyltransferase domain-containing protein [Desulfuromonadales bacterium]
MDGAEFSLEAVKEYYGKVLQGMRDLKTNACTCTESLPLNHQKILAEIDNEILDKFYGCGSPIPPALDGCTVLDLGCGTGRDAYLASRLVGPDGFVIGVDMTQEQLEVARRHQASQATQFGFGKSNVDFRQGYIEDLASLGITDNSINVVISNCVINLSPQKEKVFSEIFRVLKPGGELYFSDVFAGRRIPQELRNDPVLLGECLGGAMYIEDFRRLLRSLGCLDYRVVSKSPISIDNPGVEAKIGMIDFYSIKVRAFKLSCLEDICEDYGQVASYLGTIPDHPYQFPLDDHHTFITGKPMLVCGNTAAMVGETRFAKHFRVIGDCSVHFGPFDCSPASKESSSDLFGSGSCC